MVRFTTSAVSSFLIVSTLLTDNSCWAQRGLKAAQKVVSKSKGGKGDKESCGSDCKNTIPDFVKNILNLGFDEDTELLSGFGYCEGDFDKNFDKLCCSASALRATIGGTWLDSITSSGQPGPFIPSTLGKPNFFDLNLGGGHGMTSCGRRLNPEDEDASNTTSGEQTLPPFQLGETEAILGDLFRQAGLAAALSTALEDPDTRRRLGVSDAALTEASRKLKAQTTAARGGGRNLELFEDDDGVVCILAVVVSWFVEFYIGQELDDSQGILGEIGPAIAGGVGDAIRRVGCDISGLLTEKCEDFAPVLNLKDIEGFDDLIEGYVASELSFLICKLIKEAIAALALYIFSPWLLPACHCAYRTEKQCNVDSCYDLVDGGGSRTDTWIPPGNFYAPKQNLIDDIGVAATQYFPFQQGGMGFTELLRSCNAIPGDRSYFIGRLPEGEIGGVLGDLGDLFLGGLAGDLPTLPPFSSEAAEYLGEIGKCFDLTNVESFSYEDAEAMYEFMFGIASPIETVTDCLNTLPSGVGAAKTFLTGLQGAFADLGSNAFEAVLIIALSFFLANDGDLEVLLGANNPYGLLGSIINEILGEDLIEALSKLELGGGLFPVRRGGEPFDECLGYCFMHGNLNQRKEMRLITRH